VYVLSSVRPLEAARHDNRQRYIQYYDFLEELGLYEKEELRGQENDKPKERKSLNRKIYLSLRDK
jgi:hypothetical protein